MKPYDLTNPRQLLECQVKLRGSLDERMSIWWIRATQYAVIDTVLTPLYHLLNASFQQCKGIFIYTFELLKACIQQVIERR